MSANSTSLQKYHTFGLSVNANNVVTVETIAQLVSVCQKNNPILLLGAGSNCLFLEDFKGCVVINRIRGIQVTETSDQWHLHVGAGEDWHQFVRYTLEHAMPGLENLALIPGCVGSSPIQNIGAYGVELQKFCDYVDLVELASGKIIRVSGAECQFGYRESIFKHQYRQGYAIVAVGFCLSKQWQPILNYGDLKQLDPDNVNPQQVFDAVCAIRRSKLPDPNMTGNAGSFFKNPIVSFEMAQTILTDYPNAPHYAQANGEIKLAAGWLIDQCHLKGYQIGGAAVHQQQALVLINKQNATPQDVVALARHICQTVADKFNIWLEPEIRFIAAKGECDATNYLMQNENSKFIKN